MSDAHAYKQIHEIHIKIHEMRAVDFAEEYQ